MCIPARFGAGNSRAIWLDQALTLAAWERALTAGRRPVIHHSDQGVQYAATAYIAQLEQLGTQISMAEQGEPRQTGSAERLMRTLKDAQRGGGGADRVPRLRGRLRPAWALSRQRLPAEAQSLRARLSDADGV